jgi:hypothetical protein
MAKCRGTCKKQETQAQNVKVTGVKRKDVSCPELKNEDAQTAIQADVIADQAGTEELEKCKSDDCRCEWNRPPEWPNWTTVPFDWTYTTEKTEKKKTVKCVYDISGTVEVRTRIVDGTCWPKRIKGKTTKKLG